MNLVLKKEKEKKKRKFHMNMIQILYTFNGLQNVKIFKKKKKIKQINKTFMNNQT